MYTNEKNFLIHPVIVSKEKLLQMKKLLIMIVFITGWFCAGAQLKPGDIAPDFSLPGKMDSVISLSSFRGKIVLIDFWASWCGPCRAANPGLVKLYDTFKSKGFEIFGVSIDNKKTAWLNAIAKDHINYTQVNDKAGWNSPVAEKYGVEAIPTSFLVDQAGKIVAIDAGGIELENNITELLNTSASVK
jgi:peroxiredoxin